MLRWQIAMMIGLWNIVNKLKRFVNGSLRNAFFWRITQQLDIYFIGQKPQACSPGISFEKQQLLRKGVLIIAEGLRPPV